MNHGSGIFWDIFNAARLLSKCLGRAVRAQAGCLLAAVAQPGGLGGSAAPRGAVTPQPCTGEVTRAGTSVPMHSETTLCVMGGGKRGSWRSTFLLEGEVGGEKVSPSLSLESGKGWEKAELEHGREGVCLCLQGCSG